MYWFQNNIQFLALLRCLMYFSFRNCYRLLFLFRTLFSGSILNSHVVPFRCQLYERLIKIIELFFASSWNLSALNVSLLRFTALTYFEFKGCLREMLRRTWHLLCPFILGTVNFTTITSISSLHFDNFNLFFIHFSPRNIAVT